MSSTITTRLDQDQDPDGSAGAEQSEPRSGRAQRCAGAARHSLPVRPALADEVKGLLPGSVDRRAIRRCQDGVRRVVDATNAIEALNRQLRKALKTKGSFPSEEAARKLIYLEIQNAMPPWTHTRGWTKALLAFKI